MESNSRSATDMDDQAQVIHLKEISVDFIKTRPISDLELVFKDDAGVTHTSNKFKSRLFLNSDPVRWNLDIYLKTHTSATLTIQRALFKIGLLRFLSSLSHTSLETTRLSVWKTATITLP
ncbi:hypothetical protein EDB84DRAFT_67071 [Lactarius hengduanensis]|nr:hypothetical protein EDB84DRAFT_67071 [Lactarius hengduanensis]